MAVISDIAGTTNDSFSINGKATIFQGKREPKTILGKNGDIYFQSNGDIFSKKGGVWELITKDDTFPSATQGNHQLLYSNGSNYDFTDITYEKLNNNNIITTIPGKVVLPKTPDATASFNNSDEKILLVPNINWINDPERSLNVVHRSGDETIDDEKTFNSRIIRNINTSNSSENIIHVKDTESNAYMDEYLSQNENIMGRYYIWHKELKRRDNNINHSVHLELFLDTKESTGTAQFGIYNGLNTKILNTTRASDSINDNSFSTKGWVSNPETSINVVHRSGDETLTGIKTFTADPIIAKNYPNLFIKNTDIIKGNRVNETKYSQIAYRDKNGKELGYVRHAYYTNNNINESRIELVAVDPDPNHTDDNRIDTFLTIKSTPTNRSATLNFNPEPSSSTSDSQIATLGWANDPEKSTNVVHRSGDETIDGIKILKDKNLRIKSTVLDVLDRNTADPDNNFIHLGLNDKNDREMGHLKNYLKTNGDIITEIGATKYLNGNMEGKSIGILNSINGTSYGFAPTPSDDAENKEIVTAEWVRKNISGKKLGEMVWSSVPLDDIGLLLMDGRKLKQSEYPEFYDFISNINRTTYPNLVKITSETTSGRISRTNNDYGVFYINTTQKAIWLPDYSKSFALITSENDNNLGSYSKGKLPNITGKIKPGKNHGGTQATGCFYETNETGDTSHKGETSVNIVGFDASRSPNCSDIYDNSTTTVQPESVKVYVYIVVANFATSSSGSINVDELIRKINEFETLLNQKANDSDVVHKTGNEEINDNKTFNGNTVFNGNVNINNVAYGKTPNNDAIGDEIITANWAINNISGKSLGEFVFTPIVPNDLSGLEKCDGRKLLKSTYPEFYDYMTEEPKHNVINIDSLPDNNKPEFLNDTFIRIKETYRDTNNSWGYFYYNEEAIWLPDYTKSISLVQTDDKDHVGDYTKGGLPNITGRTHNQDGYLYEPANSGAFYKWISHGGDTRSGDGGGASYGLFDASYGETKMDGTLQNDVYGKSDVVKPESIKIYVFIVVSTHVKGNTGSLNINSLINEINTYKNAVIELNDEIDNINLNKIGFPDYSSSYSLSWNTEYTASEDGWIFGIHRSPGDHTVTLLINNNSIILGSTYTSVAIESQWQFPIKNGSTYSISTDYPSSGTIIWIPCINS